MLLFVSQLIHFRFRVVYKRTIGLEAPPDSGRVQARAVIVTAGEVRIRLGPHVRIQFNETISAALGSYPRTNDENRISATKLDSPRFDFATWCEPDPYARS